jgi:hypothetical protein
MDKHAPEIADERPGWWRRRGRVRSRAFAGEGAAPETMTNVRRAGIAMLVAFALMAAFNSGGLRSWTRDLPPGWVADQAVAGADAWHALMVALGPAAVRPAVHAMFESVRRTKW